jgi:pyruvate dehydrogenase E2 component (dihydrolipoamide acetyltransferase)
MVKLLMMWQRLRLPRHLRQLRQQQQLTKSLQTHQPPPQRPHLCLHHPQRIHKARQVNAFLPARWRAGLLRIRGVDLASLAGSGPHGRILRRDVEAAETRQSSAGVAAMPANAPMSAVAGASTVEANSQMRRIIAQRLQESKANAPHFYLTVDCEIDNLLAARRMMNEQAGEGVKISVNDLVIRAAAMALIAVPKANASWEGENTRYFQHADIAMAVAVDGGLVTPVVWAAEQKGLAALSGITRDLALRAREGKLAPEEFSGGSFTISNLGMYGIREFAAVINPPQGAILAVGAGEERPVVRDGQLAVATVMSVTLSADHRVVDGAVGAEWLQAFKGYIQQPVTMLL